ncbi:DUF2171 domain-containing protein [Roseomonas sp. 18066]|uniref:DUF2171 domain-containing protein n=1 Tax=Roseomonas sp. 18066 TaxID=2681412 RepID=UPI00135788BE|nr:DUF2171 domain-containing protein [Roseomonas sp. 18066]
MVDTKHIADHMEVVGSCGNHVGTVDHLDGSRIKLTAQDSADGRHHFLALDAVAEVRDGKVVTRMNHKQALASLQAA